LTCRLFALSLRLRLPGLLGSHQAIVGRGVGLRCGAGRAVAVTHRVIAQRRVLPRLVLGVYVEDLVTVTRWYVKDGRPRVILDP